ncbi:MAG: hypothetical protein V4857_19980 [Pseudomonadota bacterium]
MINRPQFDSHIPVLTEVVQDASAPPALVDGAPPPPRPPGARLEVNAIEGWTEPEWSLLERRLSERILQQLQGRIDFVLEQRLRDSMAEVLQHAITGLTAEIRSGLQSTIEHVVARAVAQELAQLKTQQK